MIDFDQPTSPRSCLDCAISGYEENEEEVEVLVCYRFRHTVRRSDRDAEDCAGYSGADD